jgi:hypothetical protein
MDIEQLLPRRLQKSDYIEFVLRCAPTHFVTLATNWDDKGRGSVAAKKERLSNVVHKAVGRVDRDLCGRGFVSRAPIRLRGCAFTEHIETNIHVHCFLALHSMHCPIEFERLFVKHWKAVVPSGNADVQLYDGHRFAALYSTKEFARLDFADTVIPIAPR